MNRKTLCLAAAILAATIGASAQDDNCFGMIAGKDCTVDGSVIFAHNEDEGGEQMLNVYKVPADKAAGTYSYVWVEFPGLKTGDGFMNEWGVCVCSDKCSSREDGKGGELVYEIRTDVAKYARSAREAVKVIGHDVETRGYADSGRSYLIADPNEGWIVSIVKGHHWVAMRVPDDKVLVIPNYYVIDKVDLSDTANFLGSADIVTYAESRGWYDPAKDGEFSFRKAYSNQNTLVSHHNSSRHKVELDFLTGGTYDYDPLTVQPCITPAHKLSVQDCIDAMSQHEEVTDSHKHPQCVCNDNTVVTTIFQLRSWMPRSVGCLMWMAAGRPCSEVFVPVYLGVGELPSNFGRFDTAAEAIEKHFSDSKHLKENYPDGFYWAHVDAWQNLSEDYGARIEAVRTANAARQQALLKQQPKLEKKLLKMSEKRAADRMSTTLRQACESRPSGR